MFYFDPVNDIDLDSYAYELYDNPAGTGAAVATGRNKANVFTISVTNSTDSTPKTYYGRVAVVNSAGTVGTYTSLVSSGETPLIGEQYITSLTAAKITAGTIGAHTITLGGNSSVIKSSTYDGTFDVPTGRWTTGGAGWLISGNGQAIFDATQIRGSLTASSINLDANNYWLSSTVGPPSTPITFKVGNATNFFEWDGTNVRTTGTVITNATVSGGTVGGINAGAGATANRFYIGAGTFNNANTAFYVDSAGQFSLKNKLVWTGDALTIDGTVTIGSQTAAAVSTSVTTANNAATAAAAAQTTANSKVNPADVLNHIGGTNVTTISGGKVTTGTISSVDSTCLINLDNGSINFRNKFIVDSAGNASFAGDLSSATGSVGTNFIIGSALKVFGNSRFNYGETSASPPQPIGADGGQTIVYIRADSNDTKADNYPLRISNHNNAAPNLFRVRYDGQVFFNNAVQTSDVRVKSDILDTNLGLNFINDLRPVSYFMSLTEEYSPLNNVRKYGLIAQEVKETYQKYTESFAGWSLESEVDEDSLQVLSYTEFISPMIKAIQELSAKVDELESRMV
jgi:hypothetical protein